MRDYGPLKVLNVGSMSPGFTRKTDRGCFSEGIWGRGIKSILGPVVGETWQWNRAGGGNTRILHLERGCPTKRDSRILDCLYLDDQLT